MFCPIGRLPFSPIERLSILPDWPDWAQFARLPDWASCPIGPNAVFFLDYPIEPSEPWVPDWPDWKPEPDWTDWVLGDAPGHDGVYVQVDFPLVNLMLGSLRVLFDLGPGCIQTS